MKAHYPPTYVIGNGNPAERSYGAFSRTVPLPAGIDPAAIKASVAKGVLKVTVPKPAGAKAAKIEVKSA